MQRLTSSSSSVPNQHFNPSPVRPPLPFTGNRVGAPPLPPLSPFPAALPPKHSRSISQPSSFDSLPPVEERNGARFIPSLPPSSPVTMYHSTSTMVSPGENLPPRKSLRRTNSVDVTSGFGSMMMPPSRSLERSISGGGGDASGWSNMVKEEPMFRGTTSESESIDDILRGYVNLDNIDELNSLSKAVEEMEAKGGGSCSGSEGESNVHGVKRRAGGDFPPTGRHCRSVSMDSCFMGKPNLGGGDGSSSSLQLPPSSAKASPTYSGRGAYSVRFRKVAFSADEMERMSGDAKLTQIAMTDPRRAKRILANRESAARSKERKAQYTAQLEHKVQFLQTEVTALLAQIRHLQRDSMGLHNQNSELRFRLQATDQQLQLHNALSEKMSEEVQRLRLVLAEQSRSEFNISTTALSPEMFEQQLRISHFQ